MNKNRKVWIIGVVVIAIIALAIYYFSHHTVAVLEPRGPIAQKEKDLLLTAVGLMLIVVVPVFIMTFYIVWKYREGHQGKYKPDFDHSRLLETVWWLIPTILIGILSVMAWTSSHQLDPYRSIASTTPTVRIEAIAMDWKWLFIYPDQNVASVNVVHFPVNAPVKFYITADAPMNSFWIPQLSGQMYAMPGMSTQLNMEASSTGNFYGSSANISGNGFAGMHFMANVTSNQNFQAWVNSVRTKPSLNSDAYNTLAMPSTNNSIAYYSKPDPNLYASIINKYMGPGNQMSAMTGMN